MRRIILAHMLALFLLAACNTPTTSPLPTQDMVATQVALLITNLPTETQQAATQTPAPSPTTGQETPTLPQPTLTETLTLTLTPTAAGELKDTLGDPSWSDPLDSAKSFYLFENEGTRVTAENGALLLSGLQANGWLGWSLTYSRQPQNFYVEATFITQDCAGSDRYGLVFRAPNPNAGYFFGVTCGGTFDLSAANFETDTESDLVQASSNPAIASGSNQTNRLGVLADGETISLYANGKLLQEVNDATFKEQGYFGPFVAANQTAGFTVKMDEIKLWILP